MNISGAIFDLDGTLLDTTEIWEGVAARYITSLRKTPEPGLREKTKAMTLPMLCSYLKDEYRIATTESKIAKGFNTILREDYLESADIKQYVPILLEKFKQKGVAMCITTSTDKAIADEILVRLGIRDYFTFIMTCCRQKRRAEQSGDPGAFRSVHRKLRRVAVVPHEVFCKYKNCKVPAQTFSACRDFFHVRIYYHFLTHHVQNTADVFAKSGLPFFLRFKDHDVHEGSSNAMLDPLPGIFFSKIPLVLNLI